MTRLERRLMLAADAGAAMGSDPCADVSGEVASMSANSVTQHRQQSSKVVFVDPDVLASEVLTADISDAEVVLLQEGGEAIEQISRFLAQRTGVQSLHIVSHGAEGSLRLSGEDVSEAELRANAQSLNGWARALTADADILLYGCEVGSGVRGESLMQTLADLTHADIAASIDMTGSQDGHGNWELERHVGIVDAGIAFSDTAMRRYHHTLPFASNFDNLDLTVNGDATIEQGALQLTPEAKGQAGSAFLNTPFSIDEDASFQVAFSFTIDGDGPGADGFAFLMQNVNAGVNALGGGGGGLGFDGIGGQTVAIEFDTYFNKKWDSSGNELAITVGGEVEQSLTTAEAPFELESGETYYAWVDYSGSTDSLKVFLSDSEAKPGAAVLEASLSLDDVVGDQAYMGFSAGTGGLTSAHRIESLSFSEADPESGISFDQSLFVVDEADSSIVVQVKRSGDLSQQATVDFATRSGTATAGEDFGEESGTLIFGVGQASQQITISLSDDDDAEGTERFSVQLVDSTGSGIVSPSVAVVQITDDDQPPPQEPTFSADDLTINGDASINQGVLELTPDAKFAAGSAFFNDQVTLSGEASFQSAFSFSMEGTGAGADGFALLIQNTASGANAIGGAGGFLGYNGIGPQTVAIEFDSYKNLAWDSSDNEISITVGGNVVSSIASVDAPFTLEDGQTYHVWIDYSGASNQLSVYLSNSQIKPVEATLQATLNINDVVGDSAFMGFSAATGGLSRSHQIRSWDFSTSDPGSGGPGEGEGGGQGISLDTNLVIASETQGSIVLQLNRVGDLSGQATVGYRTYDGTAIADEDFDGVSGTATFESGESTAFVTINLIDDSDAEGTESLTFTIDGPTGATLAAPRTATIQILDDEQPLPGFPAFTSDGIVFNGDASLVGDELQLTPAEKGQAGSAFFESPIAIDANTSFQSEFSFVMDGAGPGGDGFAFLVQNTANGTNALGGAGGFLGYDGIGSKTVAVEFDTFANKAWDNSDNAITVTLNGQVANTVATVDAPFTLDNGVTYHAWVDYSATSDRLTIYLSNTENKPQLAVLSTILKLDEVVGDSAYFGFSAGTGGSTRSHRVLSWDVSLAAPPTNPSINPSGDVQATNLISGLNQPTAIVWTEDGRNMYISEKGGVVKVARDGVLLDDVVIDISDIVNGVRDRGLLDIAVHPDLDNHPYLYLLYTYDPPETENYGGLAGQDAFGNRAGRLMKVELDASNDYTTIVANSEEIILGTNSTWDNFNGFVDSTLNFGAAPAGVNPDGSYVQDFIASDSQSHTIGSLAWGLDGNLFVSTGDGASYNQVDPRAVRVQDIDNLSGKVLRIDPLTGAGIADNPFATNDLFENRSKVYQLGLRNPFRITVNDATGEVFVGDVGWTKWEEINAGGAGMNYGWPYYEGAAGESQPTGGYRNLPGANDFYDSGDGSPPLVSLNHVADGIDAIMLGDFVNNGDLGFQYEGALFFNALGSGIVRYVTFDEDGNPVSVDTFTTGARYVVDIQQGVDGSLYYVNLAQGTVGKWEIV
ncbi:MAG: lectin-like domain-containing protein [Rubripirellula sp.]